MRPIDRAVRAKRLVVVAGALLALLLAVSGADAQRPPPLPKPEKDEEPQFKPLPKEQKSGGTARRAAAALVLLTSDYDCVVELDGEEVATLTKDEPLEIKVKPGEHLLQAFAIGIEGPEPWKSAVKVPDTGKVVQMIELADVVDDWLEQQEKLNVEGRFVEIDNGAVISDRVEGYSWTGFIFRDAKWQEASKYCSSQNFGGIGGWRLPTLRELSTIYWPDHPEPQFAAADAEVTKRFWGMVKTEGDMEVLPVMVYEPFENNRLSSVWTNDKGVVCSFLGELGCKPSKRGDVLCVRSD